MGTSGRVTPLSLDGAPSAQGTLPGVETAPDHGSRPRFIHLVVGDVPRSLVAVLLGTFTLRFSTGLTGTLLIYYLAELPSHGGQAVDARALGLMTAAFFASELILATPFGMLSDRWGHHRVMQLGPAFGFVAVILTFFTTNLFLLGGTRVLEGASTAASVPSILGFIAVITAGDELLRGRAAARFEGATLAGLGAGVVAAGVVWPIFHAGGFLINAGIYVLSFLIYRFGVPETPGDAETTKEVHPGFRRYLKIVRSSHVWLLAPTWIAVNAAIGLWTTQSLFQLVKEPAPKFADQFLMGRAEPIMISVGFIIAGIVFFAGLAYWGERFRRMRRTTILFYGILGGAACVAAVAVINHSLGLSPVVAVAAAVVVVAGLFVLAGATPAALGMLADISEAFPADRGAIMGLYSVFLALGQIIGSILGGIAAEWRGIDGILIATMLALVIALVPLGRLRTVEHLIGTDASGPRLAVD
jgi:MFS family permease